MSFDLTNLNAALDSLSTAVTDKLSEGVNALVPEDVIPVSSWGDLTNDALPITAGTTTTNFSIAAGVPTFLKGRSYLMPAFNQALAVNKTFYLYVVWETGNVNYLLSETQLAEGLLRMFIGMIVTDATKVVKHSVRRVRRIDTVHFEKAPFLTPYRVISAGFSQNLLNYSGTGIWRNGVQMSNTSRSYSVNHILFDGRIVRANTYDVHAASANAESMATFLNSIPDGSSVLINTIDEPQANLSNANLRTALIRMGATTAALDTVKMRGAYVLLGVAGKTRPTYEYVAGLVDSDPNSAVEVYFDIDASGNYTNITRTI